VDRQRGMEARYTVTASGGWRGATLGGDVILELAEDDVAITSVDGARRVPLPLGTLDGLRFGEGQLTLYFADGTVVLDGEGRLAAAAREIVARACAPGELTRALRSLGSHRRGADDLQRRYFEPLLAARRKLDRATAPDAQLTALDGRALLAAYHELAHRIADRSAGEAASDKRALEAQLDESFAPLVAALEALEGEARALRKASAESSIVRWREWSVQARAVFAAADRCWPEVARLVVGWHPGPRPSLWRRMLGKAR
jgi:hypothetical protein